MGERKGTNKYYPPDYDPSVGSLNKFLGTHALRERARKIHLGIIIVRFEMPFNFWCGGCKNHIGMGVRYNAEKKKVGMYYSTPVFQFRMKCHLCDNHFEIKTDPGNLTYEVVSGGARKESRWDPTENEQIVPTDRTTSCRLYDDAMFKMEHNQNDTKKMSQSQTTLSRLMAKQDELWKDDYASNYKLRQRYREQRNREKSRIERNAAISKLVNIPLLPKTGNDKIIASAILRSRNSAKNRKAETNIKKLLMKYKQRTTTTPVSTQKLNAPMLGIKVNKAQANDKQPSLVMDYGGSSSSSD